MADGPEASGEDPETSGQKLLPAGETPGGRPARGGAEPPRRPHPPGGPDNGGGQQAPGGPEGGSVPPDSERAVGSERRGPQPGRRRAAPTRAGEVHLETEVSPFEPQEVQDRGFSFSKSGFRVQVPLLVLWAELHEPERHDGPPQTPSERVGKPKL